MTDEARVILNREMLSKTETWAREVVYGDHVAALTEMQSASLLEVALVFNLILNLVPQEDAFVKLVGMIVEIEDGKGMLH